MILTSKKVTTISLSANEILGLVLKSVNANDKVVSICDKIISGYDNMISIDDNKNILIELRDDFYGIKEYEELDDNECRIVELVRFIDEEFDRLKAEAVEIQLTDDGIECNYDKE